MIDYIIPTFLVLEQQWRMGQRQANIVGGTSAHNPTVFGIPITKENLYTARASVRDSCVAMKSHVLRPPSHNNWSLHQYYVDDHAGWIQILQACKVQKVIIVLVFIPCAIFTPCRLIWVYFEPKCIQCLIISSHLIRARSGITNIYPSSHGSSIPNGQIRQPINGSKHNNGKKGQTTYPKVKSASSETMVPVNR